MAADVMLLTSEPAIVTLGKLWSCLAIAMPASNEHADSTAETNEIRIFEHGSFTGIVTKRLIG